MRRDDLPLFAWTPPVRLIAFPATARVGHALHVARQMAKARTQREAAWAYNRACDSFIGQMEKAGFSEFERLRQLRDFRRLIAEQCTQIEAPWMPDLEQCEPNHRTPGGAA